ncbi:hypothetical protein H4W31_006718 [Plantactinospora soyae]|uniref:Uncharacterized protein n=1 Tax=Plantactinospora soyae TaxID=1544732 RepID=A0A927MH67_9ACTN|nr:hypothetical protein [Plantactinospora soyae]
MTRTSVLPAVGSVVVLIGPPTVGTTRANPVPGYGTRG